MTIITLWECNRAKSCACLSREGGGREKGGGVLIYCSMMQVCVMGCLPGCKILTLFLTSILKAFSSLFMNSNYMCKLKETLFMKMLQTVSFLTIAS